MTLLIISMGYDERSIRKSLDISRDEESDFITVKAILQKTPSCQHLFVNKLC